MHMRMHMHMHMHIQYKQVMQMHMCARLIPQLVMRAHRGRIMFGISSLFSDQQHPIYPARIYFFELSRPAPDVPRGPWRLARGEY